MDLCHCAEPQIETINGSLCCLACRLWYDEAAWKSDTRAAAAKQKLRKFSEEQIRIVNSIMRCADKNETL